MAARGGDCAVDCAVDFARHLDLLSDGLEGDVLPEEAPAPPGGAAAAAPLLDDNGESLWGQALPEAELERRAHEWADVGEPLLAADRELAPPVPPPPELAADAPPDPPAPPARPRPLGGVPAASFR